MSEGGEANAATAPMPGWGPPAIVSTLILLIANLYPLAGVALWGWDAFLLLMLYWMETVIVAFWTIVRVALSPPDDEARLTVDGEPRPLTSLATAGFFTLHAGVFIGVHLMFLWILFSGGWSQRTGGIIGFFKHAIGAEGLWVPLLFLFAVRGSFLLFEVLPARMSRQYRRVAPVAGQPGSGKQQMDGILLGLYGRIFVMQVAIIFGGWVAMSIGSMAPLILLIVCKTVAELLLQRVDPARLATAGAVQ